MDYEDYANGGGFYILHELNSYNGNEYTYVVPATGSYVIWVKNYDPYDMAYGKISYVLYMAIGVP